MSGRRHSLHCILPPYILDRLADSDEARVRRLAIDAIAESAALRATRATLAAMGEMAAIPSPRGRKHRLVYDAKHGSFISLPGTLVREEGGKASKDPAVNEAFLKSGYTYDFYKEVFGRNSLDDRGMSLISSVHLGRRLNNAFWTGEQMAYGDGDGSLFVRFTKSLDVVGHELTHGVITHTSNLEYRDEPGALNEHFADVFGSLVKQWKKHQTAEEADWLIGNDIMGPDTDAVALRTLTEEPAYEDDPLLGTDPQPKHMDDMYTGSQDNGGVHINSGIPNHVFYRASLEIGGEAWEKAGRIWYRTLLTLTATSDFGEMVERTLQEAAALFGSRSLEQKAVRNAWKAVGLPA